MTKTIKAGRPRPAPGQKPHRLPSLHFVVVWPLSDGEFAHLRRVLKPKIIHQLAQSPNRDDRGF
ncbi:hypothetical protein IIC38_01045 [candidate division KSB1 bacterium]|nr:hypothetical protein [candidate division KSB1 bacterium]